MGERGHSIIWIASPYLPALQNKLSDMLLENCIHL